MHRTDVAWSDRVFVGALLVGWGLFNVVEGVVTPRILQLHHVVEGVALSPWDWTFLGSGFALVAMGWRCISSGRCTPPTDTMSTAPLQHAG